MPRMPLIHALVASASLAGCMMGPDAPRLEPADGGIADRDGWSPAALTAEEAEAARRAAAASGEQDIVTWWTRFQDPVLDLLIARADRTNADLGQAISRVRVAQAQLGVAEAELWLLTCWTCRH